MTLRLFLVFLFLIFTNNAFAQTKASQDAAFLDRFKKEDQGLITVYNIKPAAGDKLLEEVVQNSPANKKPYYEAMKLNKAYYNYNLKEGLRIIKNLKPIIENSDDKYLKYYYYLNIAYFYEAFGSYDLLKINVENALKYAADSSAYFECKVALCKEYLQIGMPDYVIKTYEKLLARDTKNREPGGQQFDYYMLTQAYLMDNKYPKAKICLDKWEQLILKQKNGQKKLIELENYHELFAAKYDIQLKNKDQIFATKKRLDEVSKADFTDLNLYKIFLDTKQKYYDWQNMADSSEYYRSKIALQIDTETKRNLKGMEELEQEAKYEKSKNQNTNIFWIASVLILLVVCFFVFFNNQKKINQINIENKELTLAKYETLLKEKYDVINQAETKLSDLNREIKDANIEKKIKEIKDSIRLSEMELKFFNELNEGELLSYETIRKTLPLFTETEVRIAFLIVKNKTINSIAEILHISAKAAENHRYRIRKKMSLMTNQSLETALKEHLAKFKG